MRRMHMQKSGMRASDQGVAAPVEVLAVRQVGAPRHDQQQAALPPAARQELRGVQAGHLHGQGCQCTCVKQGRGWSVG